MLSKAVFAGSPPSTAAMNRAIGQRVRDHAGYHRRLSDRDNPIGSIRGRSDAINADCHDGG
jgi:hypothetical protein